MPPFAVAALAIGVPLVPPLQPPAWLVGMVASRSAAHPLFAFRWILDAAARLCRHLRKQRQRCPGLGLCELPSRQIRLVKRNDRRNLHSRLVFPCPFASGPIHRLSHPQTAVSPRAQQLWLLLQRRFDLANAERVPAGLVLRRRLPFANRMPRWSAILRSSMHCPRAHLSAHAGCCDDAQANTAAALALALRPALAP